MKTHGSGPTTDGTIDGRSGMNGGMRVTHKAALFLVLVTSACDTPSSSSAAPAPSASSAPAAASSARAAASASVAPSASAAAPNAAPRGGFTVKALPLPGATAPASLDYIACERPRAARAGFAADEHSRVWVPVGATGSVDVLDIPTGAFTRVDGFKTAEHEAHGKKRLRGPSAVAVGELFAYVGDRATNEVCPVELKTLARKPCLKLSTEIDGVAYVAATKEVWVTTPEEQSLTVLETTASGTLKVSGTVKVGGAPEGYAVDESRGLFFTNLEDKGGTVVIDVKKRAVTATWAPGCGADGPRGVAVDEKEHVVLVACTDHIQALDAGANGSLLGKLDTGPGVDNIELSSETRQLYVAAGKAARLTVAHVGAHGAMTVLATVDTREGARNAVADAMGNAYIADSAGANLLVASHAP